MKVTKRELLRRIEALEKWSEGADSMLTELNHALPDPEYDAKCEAQEADIDASLDRHAARLGLKNPELAGSGLCRAMLERGDKIVLCAVSDTSDTDALECNIYDAITLHKDGRANPFESSSNIYMYAVPINNQGEPLTASEVGL